MSRKRHTNGVLAYLASIGILEHGTPADIAAAKVRYWKQYRQQYMREQRKHRRSVTVSYAAQEYAILTTRATVQEVSVSEYIKVTSLSVRAVSAATIGTIRALLMEYYQLLDTIIAEIPISKERGTAARTDAERIETTIISTLQAIAGGVQ